MDKIRFLDTLLTERTEWDRVLSQIDEARMTAPGVAGEWSAKDVVAHVTWFEREMVGVLATPTTFDGDLYASVVERFGQGVTILPATCPGLVVEIEAGRAHGPKAQRILAAALEPMLAVGVDTIVLGCTHYPFAFDTIRGILGERVRLIDPAPAIARRVESLLESGGLRNPEAQAGNTRYLTSGDPMQMQARVRELLGLDVQVEGVDWNFGEINFPLSAAL